MALGVGMGAGNNIIDKFKFQLINYGYNKMYVSINFFQEGK